MKIVMKTHWKNFRSYDNCSVSLHCLFLYTPRAYYCWCLFDSSGYIFNGKVYICICMIKCLLGEYFKYLPAIKKHIPKKTQSKRPSRGKCLRFISSRQLNSFCVFAHVALLFNIQDHDLVLSHLANAGIIPFPFPW